LQNGIDENQITTYSSEIVYSLDKSRSSLSTWL